MLLTREMFEDSPSSTEEAPQVWFCPEDGGAITVLDRVTGYMGSPRDTETGYRDNEGAFWLASCMYDIRDYLPLSVEDAVAHIKRNANTCVGNPT